MIQVTPKKLSLKTEEQISESLKSNSQSIAFKKSRGGFPLRLFLFSVTVVTIAVVSGGCAVTQTRPLQEMHIADAALRAAREVNADAIEGSNIPEIYRAAADNLFKAKKEYRLKKFDRAKWYAMKATALAEKAEFEAIKSGGATPEAANAREQLGLEGAVADPNWGLDQSLSSGLNQEKHAAKPEHQPPAPPPPSPLLPPEPEDKGTLVTELENKDTQKVTPPATPSGAAPNSKSLDEDSPMGGKKDKVVE